MIRFNSDYTEGCHPAILRRLEETNMEQTAGYGEDEYCREAAERIKAVCEAPDANVHFLVGGTQTNVTVIASALRPYQGAITATTGHINVHETGALEACGYKCLTIDTPDGKLTAEQVEKYTKAHFADESFEHMVQPKLVYISNPTELGTIYKKAELEALYRVCRENDLYLFLDGARLGYGLACRENDLTMADIAANTDVFYIGGTKAGALCGEAVVFTGDSMPKHFLTRVKQHGALLAKGRLTGVQFDALFTDDLYLEIGKNAIETATVLKAGLKEKGYTFYIDSPTNQQFVVLENRKMEELKKDVQFSFWEKKDDTHTVVRFATSWATRMEDVEKLLSLL